MISAPKDHEICRLLEDCLVRTILSPKAQAQYQKGLVAKSELREFAASIKRLSLHYTSQAGLPSRLSPREAEAYALYYLPLNFVKILHLLRQVPSWPGAAPLKVLDFGCGPGTASLAAIAFFDRPLCITAVDISAPMLETGKSLVQNFLAALSQTRAQTKHRLDWLLTKDFQKSDLSYDLIIAANVLSEIAEEDVLPLLETLSKRLSKRGVLILLEPALFASTRRLMSERGKLLEAVPELKLLFPCTHSDDCPMLKFSSKDWCHGTLGSAPGSQHRLRLLAQLDKLTGFNKHRLKYAAFVLQKGGKPKDGFRVITPLRKTRRGYAALVCGGSFYSELILPSRARGPLNAKFTKVKQYERLTINGGIKDGELTANNKVEIA